MPALLSLSLFASRFIFFGCCIFLADQTHTLPAAASASASSIGRSGGVSVACTGRWEEKSREGIKCWRKLVKKNLVHLLLLEQQKKNKNTKKNQKNKTEAENIRCTLLYSRHCCLRPQAIRQTGFRTAFFWATFIAN